MSTQVKEVASEKELDQFFKGKVFLENTFESNASLFKSVGKSIAVACTIEPGSKGGWWIKEPHQGQQVSTGTKFSQLQDMFDEGITEVNIKMVLQEPRPESEVQPTIEYVLGLERGQQTIDKYREYLKQGAVRCSIAVLMD